MNADGRVQSVVFLQLFFWLLISVDERLSAVRFFEPLISTDER